MMIDASGIRGTIVYAYLDFKLKQLARLADAHDKARIREDGQVCTVHLAECGKMQPALRHPRLLL